MKQTEKTLKNLLKRRWIAIVIIILYVLFLGAYGYNSYAKDMVDIKMAYIAVGFVMAVAFIISFVFFLVAKLPAKFIVGVLIVELAVTVLVGILFLSVGFIAAAFFPPAVFLGTLCGLREKNILFEQR